MRQALLILLVCFGFVANAQSDWPLLLKQACRQFDSALIARDAAKLRILLTEHFRMTHSNGLSETKTELLQHLSTGFLKYDTIIQEGDATLEFEEELGFVGRNLSVSGSLNGKPFSVKLKADELWTWDYKKKVWQMRWRVSKKTN